MVGKIFPTANGEQIIGYHEASGPQELHALEAPAGVDREVAAWLVEHAVDLWVHHEADTICSISPADLADGPLMEADGRLRHYPHRSRWDFHPALWFEVPWIPKHFTVRLRTPEKLTERKPRCQDCGRELSVLNKNRLCGQCHVRRVGIKKL